MTNPLLGCRSRVGSQRAATRSFVGLYCGIIRQVNDLKRASDNYAGDVAWTEWFEICSVAGCADPERGALRAEIESALFARLSRFGLTRADIGGEDPVAFFDAYFKLKGSREKAKPLKSYFRHRIAVEGLRLRDFVCGTLFGARSGRVHDIVIDWIAALKGWRTRYVRDAAGASRIVWETAGGESGDVAALELPSAVDPAAQLDESALRASAERLIARVAAAVALEKSAVALLLWVTAMDVSLTEPAILTRLGVGKSRVYQLREKILPCLKAELARTEGANDPLFARLMVEVCEKTMGGPL